MKMTTNVYFILCALVAAGFPVTSPASIPIKGLEGEKMLYLWITTALTVTVLRHFYNEDDIEFYFYLFALVAVRFPLASAASIANRGLEGEKMLYLWIMSVSDDMNGLADVLAMPPLREAINKANLRGLADFLQELSYVERFRLSHFLRQLETGQADKNTIFRPVATALGEGDNWVYFPKTVKFFWHMWSFYDWMEEIKQKNYSTAFHYQKDVFGGILCPCKMCLTLDASTCIDVSKDRVERISQSG